jgi:PPK2 family polyphosphate:nucleotide phosphotransferase
MPPYKQIAKEVVERTLVAPGKKISLRKHFDPGWTPAWYSKRRAAGMLARGTEELTDLQAKLYAQDVYGLLIVLQALDAAGKDGTIKHVMSGLNPQGCRVTSFKQPSAVELDHDYMWRCIRALPPRGHIGIFNRSYYEEVLVVRVHPEFLEKQKLPPEARRKDIWDQRFQQINCFEKYLYENGFHVLKFFLHISKEEQKRRFLERIDTPEKHWKFSQSDVEERAYFDDYLDAYEDCLRNTSTKWAPWHVIPADNKPFARLAVSLLICNKLCSLDLAYPKVTEEQRRKLAEARWLLENEQTGRKGK